MIGPLTLHEKSASSNNIVAIVYKSEEMVFGMLCLELSLFKRLRLFDGIY